MKTKLDIITETQEAYPHTFNRAVDDWKANSASCYYINVKDAAVHSNECNGAMCAVGRCLIEPRDAQGFVSNLDAGTEGGIDTLLREEYRGHSWVFWQELQRFHDCGCHFEEGGLSVKGLTYLSELRTRWEGK